MRIPIAIAILSACVPSQIAGDALSRMIAQQRERSASGALERFESSAKHGKPRRAAEAEDVPSRTLNRPKDTLVFGAVYEHCDSTGRPKIISSTGMLPEQQFLEVPLYSFPFVVADVHCCLSILYMFAECRICMRHRTGKATGGWQLYSPEDEGAAGWCGRVWARELPGWGRVR